MSLSDQTEKIQSCLFFIAGPSSAVVMLKASDLLRDKCLVLWNGIFVVFFIFSIFMPNQHHYDTMGVLLHRVSTSLFFKPVCASNVKLQYFLFWWFDIDTAHYTSCSLLHNSFLASFSSGLIIPDQMHWNSHFFILLYSVSSVIITHWSWLFHWGRIV